MAGELEQALLAYRGLVRTFRKFQDDQFTFETRINMLFFRLPQMIDKFRLYVSSRKLKNFLIEQNQGDIVRIKRIFDLYKSDNLCDEYIIQQERKLKEFKQELKVQKYSGNEKLAKSDPEYIEKTEELEKFKSKSRTIQNIIAFGKLLEVEIVNANIDNTDLMKDFKRIHEDSLTSLLDSKIKENKITKYISEKLNNFISYLEKFSAYNRTKEFLSKSWTFVNSSIFGNSIWITSAIIGFLLVSYGTPAGIVSLTGTIAIIIGSTITSINSMRSMRRIIEEHEYLKADIDIAKKLQKLVDKSGNQELRKLYEQLNDERAKSKPHKENFFSKLKIRIKNYPNLYSFLKVVRDRTPLNSLQLALQILSFNLTSFIMSFCNSIMFHTNSTLNRKERDDRKKNERDEISRLKSNKAKYLPGYNNVKELKNKFLIDQIHIELFEQVTNGSLQIKDFNKTKERLIKERNIDLNPKITTKIKSAIINALKDLKTRYNPFYSEAKMIDDIREKISGSKQVIESTPDKIIKATALPVFAEAVRNSLVTTSIMSGFIYLYSGIASLALFEVSLLGAIFSQAFKSSLDNHETVKTIVHEIETKELNSSKSKEKTMPEISPNLEQDVSIQEVKSFAKEASYVGIGEEVGKAKPSDLPKDIEMTEIIRAK